MTHPLWLAQNLMNQPFLRAQNPVTHPPFAPTYTPPPLPPAVLIDQAWVVQKADNPIHWINHYPVDSLVCFVNTYPLDSDLSSG